MECVPTPKVDVVKSAVSPFRGTVPKTVDPSKNVTDPVAPVGTVAVKDTGVPEAAEVVEATSVSVPAACATCRFQL